MANREPGISGVHRYVVGIKEGRQFLFIEREEIGENARFTHGELARRGGAKNARGGNLLIGDYEDLIHVEESGCVSPSDQKLLDRARENGVFWVD